MVSKCGNCNRHLGYIIDADINCKCGHVTIIRGGEIQKVVLAPLYTPRKN